jgi:hypothetical protein
MSGLQQNYWVFHKSATEFFEEANAINTNAPIFDLKKRILQGCVQLDGVRKHPLV